MRHIRYSLMALYCLAITVVSRAEQTDEFVFTAKITKVLFDFSRETSVRNGDTVELTIACGDTTIYFRDTRAVIGSVRDSLTATLNEWCEPVIPFEIRDVVIHGSGHYWDYDLLESDKENKLYFLPSKMWMAGDIDIKKIMRTIPPECLSEKNVPWADDLIARGIVVKQNDSICYVKAVYIEDLLNRKRD